jgi:hypothetical protein
VERPREPEPLLVWFLFALVAVEILVTYSRIPPGELYHVSGHGLEGGASRALVFANYPVALAAIAVLATIAPAFGPRGRALALFAAVLSAAVFWPGVVTQADLDARPVNAIAAAGVAIAIALSLGRTRPLGRAPGDRMCIAAAALLLLAALPWEAADLGLYLPGDVFLSAQHPGGSPLAAVHHGHHHGMDGTLLVLTVLLLSRALRPGRVHALLAAYLSLMLGYGLGNIVNDGWLEQVAKRGWTTHLFPPVTTPALNWGWAAILAVAALSYALWLRPATARSEASPPLRAPASGTRA